MSALAFALPGAATFFLPPELWLRVFRSATWVPRMMLTPDLTMLYGNEGHTKAEQLILRQSYVSSAITLFYQLILIMDAHWSVSSSFVLCFRP